jgi:hypothetical protein
MPDPSAVSALTPGRAGRRFLSAITPIAALAFLAAALAFAPQATAQAATSSATSARPRI